MTIISLTSPVIIGNNKVSELSLRQPKVRDRLAVEKIKKSDVEKEIHMIANLAEVEPAVIEELTLADYAKVQKALMDFLEPTPQS